MGAVVKNVGFSDCATRDLATFLVLAQFIRRTRPGWQMPDVSAAVSFSTLTARLFVNQCRPIFLQSRRADFRTIRPAKNANPLRRSNFRIFAR